MVKSNQASSLSTSLGSQHKRGIFLSFLCIVSVIFDIWFISCQDNLPYYQSFKSSYNDSPERRVFYVDCTYSMISLGIFDKVKEDVKNAIDAIDDERTEIVVVPFSDGKPIHALPDPAWKDFATYSGKLRLKKKIDGMTSDTHTMTNHYVALNDFFTNWDNDERTTFFYLITDGDNEEKIPEFNSCLNHWTLRYLTRKVYGYYVMVAPETTVNQSVSEIINRQRHLWLVYGGLSKINQLRAFNHIEHHIQEEEFVDVPISGDYQGCILVSSLKEMSDYRIEKAPMTSDGHLQLYLRPAIGRDITSLPDTCTIHVQLSVANNTRNVSLIDDVIEITCINSLGKHFEAVPQLTVSDMQMIAADSGAIALPVESLEAIALIDAFIKGQPLNQANASHWEIIRQSEALFLTYVGNRRSKVSVENIEAGIVYRTDMKFDAQKRNCDLYSIDWTGHHIAIESMNGVDGYIVIALSKNLHSIYNERLQSIKDFYQ